MPERSHGGYRCFVALPHTPHQDLVGRAIMEAGEMTGFKMVSLGREPVPLSTTIQEALIGEIAASDCIIADVTERNANVFFELGLAQAMGKGVLLIALRGSLEQLPFDIREFRVLQYELNPKGLHNLAKEAAQSLSDYRKFPTRSILHPEAGYSFPFFVDWERLGPREMENLCRELLAQLGFQRLQWGKYMKEVDLVAQLPKKDPDGFEYNELWLISLGLRAPIEMVLDMAQMEPDYLFHRVLRYSESMDQKLAQMFESPITLLFVLLRDDSERHDLTPLIERFERRRMKSKSPFPSLRIRIWDRTYIGSLIRRFPQIGYKYFSDEVRIRSKTRKSYEELYKENSSLAARQARLINQLEDEKNRRIRAERDSVWRDISFSAAHKIGNPIFAIETDLDPLVRRIREKRTPEAMDVIKNIRSAVEKAKCFVNQFKSLAKSQEMKPVPTVLKPILDDACRSAVNRGVECQVNCPVDLTVSADPERLGECFDELVANALHWLDKQKKSIELVALAPAPDPLPEFVDSSKKYALIRVTDNGPGIPVAEKERIFDAFFTTYDQGTGLGLALVRRVIDGHGGSIRECGRPGHGASFEIYLPIHEPATKNVKSKKKSFSKQKKE